MATAPILCFQVPREKIQQCYNSGAVSALMLTTLGIATILARDPMGNMDPTIGNCIAIAPFIGSKLIQYLVPATDIMAIDFGAFVGAGTALAAGLTDYGYSAGAVASALTATTLAAARVRVIHPANNS